MKQVLIEDDIEFVEVTYSSDSEREPRTVEFLEVGLFLNGQEECHLLRIVKSELKKYYDTTSWCIFYDWDKMISENRSDLRKLVSEYVRSEYLNLPYIEELREDLRIAHAKVQGQYFQIENQKSEIERLETEVMKWKALAMTENKVVTMQSAINTMYDGHLGCRIKEVKKTA